MAKGDDEGNFTYTEKIVVCHTEGCISNGYKNLLRIPDFDDVGVSCGQCGEDITDIRDPDEDEDDGDSED